jgi:hypothetical protein
MNFFNRREYNLPEPTEYIKPELKEPEVWYSIGRTDIDTHMTLNLGHTTFTMSKQLCKDLIAQLELVSNQLEDIE